MSKVTTEQCCSLPEDEGLNKQRKKNTLFFLTIAVFTIIALLPTPPPFHNGTESIYLTAEAKLVIASLFFAVTLWVTEAVPFPITSLLLLLILHATGVSSFTELAQIGFGSSVLLFFMGAMGLSSAMTASGLAKRFMLMVLSKIDRSTKFIVLAFMTAATLTSMWVTDMAVAAMLLPLGMTIVALCCITTPVAVFGRFANMNTW